MEEGARVRRVGLIACSASKQAAASPASRLYTGDLFRKSLAWAGLHCDEALILSARHGLVALDQLLAPYDDALQTKSAARRAEWGRAVAADLDARYKLFHGDEARPTVCFVLLAGRTYVDPLLKALEKSENARPGRERPELAYTVERPLKSLGIGAQKSWLLRNLGTARSAS